MLIQPLICAPFLVQCWALAQTWLVWFRRNHNAMQVRYAQGTAMLFTNLYCIHWFAAIATKPFVIHQLDSNSPSASCWWLLWLWEWVTAGANPHARVVVSGELIQQNPCLMYITYNGMGEVRGLMGIWDYNQQQGVVKKIHKNNNQFCATIHCTEKHHCIPTHCECPTLRGLWVKTNWVNMVKLIALLTIFNRENINNNTKIMEVLTAFTMSG